MPAADAVAKANAVRMMNVFSSMCHYCGQCHAELNRGRDIVFISGEVLSYLDGALTSFSKSAAPTLSSPFRSAGQLSHAPQCDSRRMMSAAAAVPS